LTTGQRVSAKLQDAGDAIRAAGDTVTQAVAANPVPLALISAGMAWLLFGNRVRSTAESISAAAAESELLDRARERFEDVSSRVNQRLTDAAASAKDAVGESLGGAAGAVRKSTNRLGQYTQESARAVGSTLNAGASAIGQTAKRGYEYSREGVANAWQHHPLTSGLTVLAAGVAIGMLLPGTVRENGLLGKQSDAVARRVKSATQTLSKRGKKVLKSVTQSIQKEAEGEGLAVAEVARKVRRIAGHVQEATVNAVKREQLNPIRASRKSA
jgi:hypothetical protein